MNFAERAIIAYARTKNPKLAGVLEECVRKNLPPEQILNQANEKGLIKDSDFVQIEKNLPMINSMFHISLSVDDVEKMRKKIK